MCWIMHTRKYLESNTFTYLKYDELCTYYKYIFEKRKLYAVTNGINFYNCNLFKLDSCFKHVIMNWRSLFTVLQLDRS